jgi:hypothetical protein
MRHRALLLIPVLLLAAACNTTLSTDRVAPGGSLVVSTSTGGFPTGGNTSPCPPDSDVAVFVDGEEVASGTADAIGAFEIDLDVPAEVEEASYTIHAECTPQASEGNPEPTTVVLNPAELIVVADLTMAAAPQELAPGETFDVEGSWCVSDNGSTTPPEADITFEGETENIVAPDPQPFGETWVLEDLVAPATPGTYEVTGVCSYEDLILPPGLPPLGPLGEVEPAEIDPVEGAVAVVEEYPVVTITVVQPTTTSTTQPTTTTTTTATTAPPAVAPAAQARGGTPAYTG